MVQLYTHTFGQEVKDIKKLPGAGSNRQYFRIYGQDGSTCIGVKGDNPEENHTFLALAEHMYHKGLSVPKIYAVSEDKVMYLQEDLGDTTIFDLIKTAKMEGNAWNSKVTSLLHTILSELPKIQFLCADGFDFNNCYREKDFTSMNIRWDLNYFKYCFLKLTGITFDELKLEDDFNRLEEVLLSSYDRKNTNSFLYRDFQSRNVLIKDNKPYYIDFQGGYKGPFYYDIASFLWQVRAEYPEELRYSLLDTYYKALQPYYNIDAATFNNNLEHYIVFRLLQVLGAYGYRGLHEHKSMFITPITQALKEIIKFNEGSYLHQLLTQVASLPQFQEHPTEGQLVVRVTSFSYKKGIPEDYSGNGGGFVFDCRAPLNPGRYPEYKSMTGLDKQVIDFLESTDSMPSFIRNVYGLVDPAVETYLNRGFTSLMINCGCTGGQHRSVYCAQHVADHLADKYPNAKIILTHREQGIYKEYN